MLPEHWAVTAVAVSREGWFVLPVAAAKAPGLLVNGVVSQSASAESANLSRALAGIRMRRSPINRTTEIAPSSIILYILRVLICNTSAACAGL